MISRLTLPQVPLEYCLILAAVAMATGQYDVEDLRPHQPDSCCADRSDVQAVLHIFED